MRYSIVLYLFLISCSTCAQNWVGIGKFNHGIFSLSTDTIADELYLIGGFSQYNYDTIGGIGRWNGTLMTTFGCGVDWDCITPINPGGFYPQVNGIARYNGDIYVTGYFNMAGNVAVNSIARWDGSIWHSLGTGLKTRNGYPGSGRGLKVINNELHVYGVFDSVDGVAYNSIAKYNGTTWSNVFNFPLIPTHVGSINWINDLAYYKSELYVCGTFTNTPIGTIYNIVKWDGADWVSVGNGIRGGIVHVNRMLVYNNELIVGGYFSKTDYYDNPGENIGAWDGTQWHELGGGVNDMVHDIKVHDDTLYACGAFKHAGGITADGIARWDGTNWCGYGTSFDNVLGSLDFYHDTLYIAGGFWTINGDSITSMAKWIGGNYIDTCGNATAIENINTVNTSISIYPNPTTTQITIEFALQEGQNVLVEIRNVLGKTVKIEERSCKTQAASGKLQASSSTLKMDVSDLAGGVYFVQIKTQERSFVRKIVVERRG